MKTLAKDTVGRGVARPDVILHHMQQVKVCQAQVPCYGHMLVTVPIHQGVVCFGRPKQYQCYLVLGFCKHLDRDEGVSSEDQTLDHSIGHTSKEKSGV